MTGKRTDRNGRHPSRVGAFVGPVKISGGDWKAIEAATGALSDEDRAVLVEVCEVSHSIAIEAEVSRSDVRATLAAITRMTDDDELTKAFDHCDQNSYASLQHALYRIDGPDFWRHEIRPAKIRAAAWLATQYLDELFPSKGGPNSKGWRRFLAGAVLGFCEAKQMSPAVSSFAGTSTPAVSLLMALLWIVDPKKSPEDDSVAVKLLTEVRGKVTA